MEVEHLMAHFAELDSDGVVLRVVVVSNDILRNDDGVEDEDRGIAFLNRVVSVSTWKQTSIHNNIRRRYAGVGFTYSAEHDAFIAPQPYPSWTLDLDDPNDWVPPVPMPTDEGYWYEWDEQWQTWTPHQIEQPTP
jgi:hypothetical protein